MRIDTFGHFSGGRSGGIEPHRDGVLLRAIPEAPAGDETPQAAAGHRTTGETTGETALQDRPARRSTIDVPSALVVLALAGPVLAVALLMIGVPRETSLTVLAGWSLAQVPLVVVSLQRLHAPTAEAEPAVAVDLQTSDVTAGIEADRAKDRLHEVRATVAGIGLTHRLLSDEQVPISGADRSRLERLYDREIARLERLLLQDDDGPAHQDVDVQSAIDPVVESLRVRGHRVAWEGTEAVAVGRPDDIAEIVHILLENAARHAPGADASVRVETGPTRLLLRVSDNGPGVPRALAPRLFERGIRSPQSPGEGIGLSIARRLAREMGGDLVLEPASAGSGATFTVVLRASAETAPCLVSQR